MRRGQVAGSTKKLFRQKGTGNARVGTKRTNKRRGGGTAKGPKPRDYEYHLPKKAVRARPAWPFCRSFSTGQVVILDDLPETAFPETNGKRTPQTKVVTGVLKAIKIGKKTTEQGEKGCHAARHDGV